MTLSADCAARAAASARDTRKWLQEDGNGLLLAAGLAYALLFLALWPPIWTSMDEACYLGMAWTLRQGLSTRMWPAGRS